MQHQRRPGPLITFGLPLGLSLLLHASLLVTTAVIVWQVTTREPEVRTPVVISFDAPGQGSMAERAPVLADPADNQADSPEAPEAQPEQPASTPAERPRFDIGTEPVPQRAPVLAGVSTAIVGERAPSLRDEVAAMDLGEFVRAEPVTSEVRFAGLGASNAASVVYVVDGSGPMVSTLPFVIDEVMRSVRRLGPSQRFSVIIFRGSTGEAGGPGYEWFTPALVRATPDVVRQLGHWLSRIEPRGSSNPLDGLRAAISMKPDAVFLLSRSIERSGGGVWQLGMESTLRELDRLNPPDRRTGTRPVVIKTIQFLDDDPSGIMQAIARRHGGLGAETENGAMGAGGAAGAYRVIRRAIDLREDDEEPQATGLTR